MSDICFGFIEFSINLENSIVSYPLTRQMVKIALTNNFSLELIKNIQDPICRTVIKETKKRYGEKTEDMLDFYLTDSPIAPDIGLGIQQFILQYQKQPNGHLPNNNSLVKYFEEIWSKPQIQKIVIIFGWDLGSYEELKHHPVATPDEMFRYLYSDYMETNGEVNSIFILSKLV